MKLKLNTQLLIYILTVSFIVFIVSTSYLNYRANSTNLNAINRTIREVQKNSAIKIKSSLGSDISALRALAASTSGTEILTEEQRVRVYRLAVNRFLYENQNFSNVKISWELGLIDPTWTKNFGRRVYSFERGDGGARLSIADLNKDGDDFSSIYYKTKVNGLQQITGIESEDPENPNIRPLYKSTILMPVFDSENNFCALVSADIEVDNFHKMVKNSTSYESLASFLITNEGQFAGMSVSNNTLEKSDIIKIVSNTYYEVKTKIDSSGFANIPMVDSTGNKLLICGVYVENEIFNEPWMLISAVPQEIVSISSNSQMTATVLIIIAGLMLIALVLYHVASKLSNFLEHSGELLHELAIGNTQSKLELDSSSAIELEQIADSVRQLKVGLSKAVVFAEEIGRGNLEIEFQPLSDNDELGISLLQMRDSLVKAQKEANVRLELDRKQNWITEGAAKFGDILREYNNDMYDFSFNIVSNLVKYIGANQGGLFVINDDNKYDVFFELTAGYAYDIRKILKKKVKPGVGLIGRCILEAESIYISNLPEDYINITSGLGEKSPQHLLIVPFKFNNEIYAVAEIASFQPIEDYKKQFVEEVGNSIASTIATVKINIRTNKLLQELRVQSNELASQEEEMRQNMEAMRSSQEAMSKKVDEFTQVNDALSTIIMTAEYGADGRLMNVNKMALDFFQKNKNSLLSGEVPLYETITEDETTSTDDFWLQIRLGRNKTVTKQIQVNGRNYKIVETYAPVQNYYGKVYKSVCLIRVSDEGLLITEQVAATQSSNTGGEWF